MHGIKEFQHNTRSRVSFIRRGLHIRQLRNIQIEVIMALHMRSSVFVYKHTLRIEFVSFGFWLEPCKQIYTTNSHSVCLCCMDGCSFVNDNSSNSFIYPFHLTHIFFDFRSTSLPLKKNASQFVVREGTTGWYVLHFVFVIYYKHIDTCDRRFLCFFMDLYGTIKQKRQLSKAVYFFGWIVCIANGPRALTNEKPYDRHMSPRSRQRQWNHTAFSPRREWANLSLWQIMKKTIMNE